MPTYRVWLENGAAQPVTIVTGTPPETSGDGKMRRFHRTGDIDLEVPVENRFEVVSE